MSQTRRLKWLHHPLKKKTRTQLSIFDKVGREFCACCQKKFLAPPNLVKKTSYRKELGKPCLWYPKEACWDWHHWDKNLVPHGRNWNPGKVISNIIWYALHSQKPWTIDNLSYHYIALLDLHLVQTIFDISVLLYHIFTIDHPTLVILTQGFIQITASQTHLKFGTTYWNPSHWIRVS